MKKIHLPRSSQINRDLIAGLRSAWRPTKYPAARRCGSAREDAGEDCPKPVFGRYRDRKSTRLNSSHDDISYAVFCLNKEIATFQCGERRRVTNGLSPTVYLPTRRLERSTVFFF